MGRKGRDDKLLATLLSTAPEERTAQQSSLNSQTEGGSQESSPAMEGLGGNRYNSYRPVPAH